MNPYLESSENMFSVGGIKILNVCQGKSLTATAY